MKFQFTSVFAAALLAGSASAHSWLDCVETNVTNYAAAKADPNITPNECLTDVPFSYSDTTCVGHPRNKINDGDWITESTYYVWNLNNENNTEGLTCRPLQSTPTYPDNVPMTTAVPGQTIRMRFWGNGHSRWDIGSPNHRDPGLIRIYWAGEKETELTYKDQLTEENWFPGAQANFSADTVNLITGNTMNEKANYFDLTLPENIENGRHSMVWVWAWEQGLESNGADFNPETDYNKEWTNTYSTCFDIMVTGSDFVGKSYNSTTSDDEDDTNACTTGTAYKGGQTAYPCVGTDCPPCWYKNPVTGIVSCFDYNAGTTTCPWGGAYDCKLNKQTRRALKHERAPLA